MNENLKLNRPDFSLANRIRIMFEADPDITADYIDATKEHCAVMIMHVSNSKKAAALRKMIPRKYDEICFPLEVVIEDTSDIDSETIEDAFEGNPHFKDYLDIYNPLTQTTFHVCIFKKEVIAFRNDNGGSLHGFEFRLMEDLARECLRVPLLIYTTDDSIPYDKNEENEALFEYLKSLVEDNTDDAVDNYEK